MLEDGERPVIIGFGTDIVEYIAMGIHQLYPEWIGNVDIAGFAMGGTKEKLGMDCSLVVKNPGNSLQFVRQSILKPEDHGRERRKEPRKYDVKVKYEF